MLFKRKKNLINHLSSSLTCIYLTFNFLYSKQLQIISTISYKLLKEKV